MTQRLRILLVGSGGREHALAWKLARSPTVDVVYVAPGNGGTALLEKVVNVDIGVSDFERLTAHSKKHGINLVVVGPEQPLVEGIKDAFQSVGIRCFGPTKAAARMEGSKAFSKDFMQRHGIPTAAYHSFTDYEAARKHVDSVKHDIVIKADGLAAGKGVIIPTSKEEAHIALKEIMVDRQFGAAGDQVVIEECLEGEELSVLTFSDGYTMRSLPPAQDHKRALDGDQGPNTGGMGCYAPTRVASKELIAEIDRTIVQPTIDGMRRDDMPFVGMLFTGLMITKTGAKVLEYNVRGGDPETQTLLPLLSEDTDLAQIMLACTKQRLDAISLKIDPKFAATVVACAQGYPASYKKGKPIHLQKPMDGTMIFHAGTSSHDKKLVTSGGRVIAATATAATLEDAIAKAYKGMETIKFEGMHFRKDIAHRAFEQKKDRRLSGAPLTYASAGVSIDAGNSLVSRIKKLTKSTARAGASGDIGGFGGVVDLAKAGFGEGSPKVILAIDGIGTKLKIAHSMNKHDTIGIDLVAMNVNDLVVQGAEPLSFLDCFSCSKLDVDIAVSFVEGVVAGCKLSKCTLAGGETAEMPGLYRGDEYDGVGVAFGAVQSGKMLLPDKESMVEGDVVLGLASDGVHSNGFSLVRRILERKRLLLTDTCPWDPSVSTGTSLLTPTRIYVVPLLKVVQKGLVKGMSHITGGGLTENVPRMLPKHLAAEIDVATWTRPEVFNWLQASGKCSVGEMARTFNNGVGMVLAVSDVASGEVTRVLEAEGETVYRIGHLVSQPADSNGCVLKNLDSWEGVSV